MRAIRAELPGAGLLYLGDQAHVPYGPRPLAEVRRFSETITRFLLSQGAQIIVVACNTASAAALHHMRLVFTDVPFVGMEPAVKPAAEGTHTGVVGVLATPATFQGELYASVVERFANGVQIFQDTCPGLVGQIEAGKLNSAETRRILENALHPMLARGVDTIVLGCTHYPFVIPLIEEIAGPDVRVLDPAPAVARQVRRVLETRGRLSSTSGQQPAARYLTTGSPQALEKLLQYLLGVTAQAEQVTWVDDDRLITPAQAEDEAAPSSKRRSRFSR